MTPTIWLGQNLRNRVLFASDAELSGAPVLISFGDAIQRSSYKQRFFNKRLRETLGITGPIMVDSGGFALLDRPHLTCALADLRAIYDEVPADIVVSLDHPPTTHANKEQRARLRKRTLRNYQHLREIAMPERLMPVVHGHSWDELLRSCESIKSVCSHPRYVGLGGLVPLLRSGGTPAGFNYRRSDGTTGGSADWVADSLAIVRRAFPRSLVHAFGVGSAVTAIGMMTLGADSVDSMSWRRAANFGAILLPGRAERFPTLRTDRVRSRPVLSEDDLKLLSLCRCPVCRPGRSLEEVTKALSSCYETRAIHNAWTVMSEVAAFREAVRTDSVVQFVKSRFAPSHRLYQPVMAQLDRMRSAPTK